MTTAWLKTRLRERERNEKTRIRSVIEVKTRKVMMNVASVTTNIIARAVDGQSRLSLFIAHMATNVQLPMVGVNKEKVPAGRRNIRIAYQTNVLTAIMTTMRQTIDCESIANRIASRKENDHRLHWTVCMGPCIQIQVSTCVACVVVSISHDMRLCTLQNTRIHTYIYIYWVQVS